MILNILDTLNKWWNEMNYWFQANYDEPLLWIGIFAVIIVFMVFCGGYLKEKGH